jgi:predicted alpha-1,2-mannosidase
VNNQRNVWNELLSRITINTNDHLQKVKFYTNLYRAFSGRNTFSDSNGQWISESGKVQQTDKSFKMLSGDAFWGSHWNLNQLWNLIWPETSSAWVKTQLELFRTEGWTARGNPGLRYIGVMTGASEIPQMVSAWQSGIRDYNPEELYKAVHHQQNSPGQFLKSGGWVGNENNELFLKHGYVPFGKGQYNSNTMEYSYQQWCAGQLFRSMGKEQQAVEHIRRGNGWQQVFDKSTGWTRPKTDTGEWWSPASGDYNPTGAPKYCEGSAWQWTWHVPHDLPGLVNAMGKDRFIERLDKAMESSKKVNFMALGDQMSTTLVNHGNQPIMQSSWMFNYAGNPWLTQKWTRSILENYYGITPYDAYPGDEDQGQMSAWLIMSSIGLFQMDGGTSTEPVYEIGSPLFEKVTLNLGGRFGRGKAFTIIAHNTSSVNKYVQKAVLNGRELNSYKFPAKELWKGGSLELTMGPQPNEQWGVK